MSEYGKRTNNIRNQRNYDKSSLSQKLALDREIKRYLTKKVDKETDVRIDGLLVGVYTKRRMPPLSEFSNVMKKALDMGVGNQVLKIKGGFVIRNPYFKEKRLISVREVPDLKTLGIKKKTQLKYTLNCVKDQIGYSEIIDEIAEKIGIPTRI